MDGAPLLEPPLSAPRSRSVWALLTLATVALALANALYSASDQGWTYDEPFNLAWSERLLTTGNAARDSQHYNSKTPATLANVLARRALAPAGTPEPLARFAARLPTVGWLAALLATVFLLGRRLFGTTAAHLATTACALDPNLVAHGSLVTVDVLYALATLLTAAAALAFAARRSVARAAALGVALGLALTAKFTAVLLVPALLLLPVLVRAPRREWPRWLAGGVVAAALAASTVCAAYLFHDVGRPLGRHWASSTLKQVGGAAPGLRLPVPRAFLTGIDASLAAERHDWNVVLLDRCYPRGVWFYFVVLWALKTPLLVLATQACGLWLAARSLRRAGPALTFLLLVGLVHLAYFSLVFRTQVGYRYVLMCLPLAYLVAAAGLAPRANGRRAPAIAAAVVGLALLENAMYVGNPLAFSSAAVWPKRDVFRLMADSNVDWGQNDERVARWLAQHPEGLHFNPPHLLPGRNLFDLNELAGVDDFEKHRFLRENAEPVAHFHHTHLWFDIDDALFDRFLETRRRLAPGPDVAPCGSTTPAQLVAAGDRLNLSLPASPRPEQEVVCVAAPAGADVGIAALRGHITFGRYRRGAACQGDTIDPRQEVWYRLDAGVHALCVVNVPEPATGAVEPFQGWWRVARRQATFRRADVPSR